MVHRNCVFQSSQQLQGLQGGRAESLTVLESLRLGHQNHVRGLTAENAFENVGLNHRGGDQALAQGLQLVTAHSRHEVKIVWGFFNVFVAHRCVVLNVFYLF